MSFSIQEDMLLNIYGFFEKAQDLGRGEIVCKEWQRVIIKHPELWKRILLNKYPEMIHSVSPKQDLAARIKSEKGEDFLESMMKFIPPMLVTSLLYQENIGRMLLSNEPTIPSPSLSSSAREFWEIF